MHFSGVVQRGTEAAANRGADARSGRGRVSRREWNWRNVSLLGAIMIVVSTTFLINGGAAGRPAYQVPWLVLGATMLLIGPDRQRRAKARRR